MVDVLALSKMWRSVQERETTEMKISKDDLLTYMVLFQIQRLDNGKYHGSDLYDVFCDVMDKIPNSPMLTA